MTTKLPSRIAQTAPGEGGVPPTYQAVARRPEELRRLTRQLINQSGSLAPRGTVCVNYTPFQDGFTTTSGGTQNQAVVGVTLEDIANEATGLVAYVGEVEHVRVDAGAVGGRFLAFSNTAGQAFEQASDSDSVFGISLTPRDDNTGTCRAILFGRTTRWVVKGHPSTLEGDTTTYDAVLTLAGGNNNTSETYAGDNYIRHARSSTVFGQEGFFGTPGTLNGVTLATVDYQVRLGASGSLSNVLAVTQAGNLLALGDLLVGGNLTTRSSTSFTGTFDHAITAARTWTLPDATGTIALLSTVAPIDADYLVGSANATLTGEIVVGTTPGGELGNTWASPTVDTTHSGSSHAALPTQTATLDMGNNVITNIGVAGTDFGADGSLTLAAALTVSAGGINITGQGILQNSGATVNHRIINTQAHSASNLLRLDLELRDSGGNNQQYAYIQVASTTTTDGGEVGTLDFATAVGGTVASRLFIGTTGLVLINDTSNANMTVGLTLNQGGADNEILAVKSSDVAHGITGVTETDTYGLAYKIGATTGGLAIDGLSSGTRGLFLIGRHTTDNTAKTTSADGAIYLRADLKSGTGTADIGADGNMVVFANRATARFIFDAEGSGHADVEWVTYDSYDDLALISAMEQTLISMESFEQTERRHLLERAGIIGRGSWHIEKGRPRAMVNMTKLAMLHHGALIQVAERLARLEARVA